MDKQIKTFLIKKFFHIGCPSILFIIGIIGLLLSDFSSTALLEHKEHPSFEILASFFEFFSIGFNDLILGILVMLPFLPLIILAYAIGEYSSPLSSSLTYLFL